MNHNFIILKIRTLAHYNHERNWGRGSRSWLIYFLRTFYLKEVMGHSGLLLLMLTCVGADFPCSDLNILVWGGDGGIPGCHLRRGDFSGQVSGVNIVDIVNIVNIVNNGTTIVTLHFLGFQSCESYHDFPAEVVIMMCEVLYFQQESRPLSIHVLFFLKQFHSLCHNIHTIMPQDSHSYYLSFYHATRFMVEISGRWM